MPIRSLEQVTERPALSISDLASAAMLLSVMGQMRFGALRAV